MNQFGMDFPKPADFEDGTKRRGPQITPQRLVVLGLLIVGGLLLGLTVSHWPNDVPFAGPLNRIQNVVQKDPKEELRDSIIMKFREGDSEQALLLCEKLIELDPSLGYGLRAEIHSAEDRPDEALADCAKLIEVDPVRGHTLRGKLLYDQDKYEEAAEEFTKLIEADPTSSDGYRLRALSKLQAGKYDEAVADAEKLAEIDAVTGYALEGQIHEEKKDYKKAVEAYGKAIKADPGNINWHAMRYQARLRADDNEGAVKDAEQLIELSPAQGYIWKGDALAKMGKSEEAVEAYGNALGHDPTNATALNNRAYHRALAKKDLVEAAKDVEEAIEIDGEQPAFVDTRGYISYLRGDFKQALADFNQALRDAQEQDTEPEFSAEIHFHRGLVYRKLGENDLAEADFKKAKELGFEWKEIPEPVSGTL